MCCSDGCDVVRADACAVGELHAFTLATLVVVWWMACDFDVSRRIRAFAAAVEIAGAGTLLAALACYVRYVRGCGIVEVVEQR